MPEYQSALVKYMIYYIIYYTVPQHTSIVLMVPAVSKWELTTQLHCGCNSNKFPRVL